MCPAHIQWRLSTRRNCCLHCSRHHHHHHHGHIVWHNPATGQCIVLPTPCVPVANLSWTGRDNRHHHQHPRKHKHHGLSSPFHVCVGKPPHIHSGRHVSWHSPCVLDRRRVALHGKQGQCTAVVFTYRTGHLCTGAGQRHNNTRSHCGKR